MAANVLAAMDDEPFGGIGWLQARHVAVGTGNDYLADRLGGEGIDELRRRFFTKQIAQFQDTQLHFCLR